MPTYSQEQLVQLYEKLPQELQKALYDPEISKNVQEICFQASVQDDDKVLDAVKNVGYVLLGILPPNQLPEILEKELEIGQAVSQIISQEIHRFIFYPIRGTLEKLYGVRLTNQPTTPSPVEKSGGNTEEGAGAKPENFSKEDPYREPV